MYKNFKPVFRETEEIFWTFFVVQITIQRVSIWYITVPSPMINYGTWFRVGNKKLKKKT